MSKGKNDDQVKLVLDSTDGAIIFRADSQQEYFVAPIGDEGRSRDIRAFIAFFIYASQNQKWVDEFNKNMLESYEEEIKAQKKPHLKIVK